LERRLQLESEVYIGNWASSLSGLQNGFWFNLYPSPECGAFNFLNGKASINVRSTMRFAPQVAAAEVLDGRIKRAKNVLYWGGYQLFPVIGFAISICPLPDFLFLQKSLPEAAVNTKKLKESRCSIWPEKQF